MRGSNPLPSTNLERMIMTQDVKKLIDDLFYGESYETMQLFVKKIVTETYNRAIEDCEDAVEGVYSHCEAGDKVQSAALDLIEKLKIKEVEG